MNNLTITSIIPLEKRPIHPAYANSRGLAENFETIFVLKGFSDGHIHAPIIWEGRYFKPFSVHPNDSKITFTIEVLCDDPDNPFSGNDVSSYAGRVQTFQNVTRLKRMISGRDEKNKPIWVTRKIEISVLDSISKKEKTLILKDILAWKTIPACPASDNMNSFCVKAIELTQKEIEHHKNISERHARIPL